MQFIDEQRSALPIGGKAIACSIERFAKFLDARCSRVDCDELRFRVVGNHMGKGRFTRAGWPVENNRTESICFKHPAQQTTGTEKMLLAQKFVQIPWAHSRSKRQGF